MKIALVRLDIDRLDINYDAYHILPPLEKLAKLIKRIRALCKELQQSEPDAKWIMVWRENGMIGVDHRYVSSAEKNAFKTELEEVTREYKQLAIVAGTIVAGKVFHKSYSQTREGVHRGLKRKLSEIEKAYETHEWLADKEFEEGEDQISKYYEQFKASRASPSFFKVLVRNTAYVFTNGTCIARHDKIAPIDELGRRPDINEIFQVGIKRNQSPYVEIKFADGAVLPVGIEICREHSFGVLERDCIINKSQRAAPVIHFVLSDFISVYRKYISGDYLMHVDSREHAFEKIHQNPKKNIELVLYVNNLLDADNKQLGKRDESMLPGVDRNKRIKH